GRAGGAVAAASAGRALQGGGAGLRRPLSRPGGRVMNAIEVTHLSRTFGSFRAVDDVSFPVERGEIFGYLGANGAGKPTTIRMPCGLLAPSGGEALVAGHSISSDPGAVKRSIGYMSQKFSLYLDLTVENNLRFFGGAYALSGHALDRRIAELQE